LRNTINWLLIIAGGVLIIAEVLLGAATGFDLALMGTALVLGGLIGLVLGSAKAGLIAAGILAFFYLAVLRRTIRSRLMGRDRPSNIDALIGRKCIVTTRIGPHAAGGVKLDNETWRATLVDGAAPDSREAGEEVTVDSVEGVTLIVR
jgi:membrane protein implicated in regulation of membrane protease activity